MVDPKKQKEYRERFREKKREQYHSDPEARERMREASRRYYRKHKRVKIPDCRAYIPDLDDYGIKRTSTLTHRKVLTYNTEELGMLINSSRSLIFKYWQDGRLPKPGIEYFYTNDNGRVTRELAYTKKEVKVILEILGKHFSEVGAYRIEHQELARKLNSRITALQNQR